MARRFFLLPVDRRAARRDALFLYWRLAPARSGLTLFLALTAALAALLVVALGSPRRLVAREPAPAVRPGAAAWPLERVRLANGKAYEGVIEREGLASIEFIEVHRPAGRPMFLVVRTIDRRAIAGWKRLPEDQRAELLARVEHFKSRSLIEARKYQDITLRAARRDHTVTWQYEGDWFLLDSTADEQTTRQSVVSIEQIFTAFRQILPPRRMPRRRLRIQLFGSTEAYREFLRGCGLEIDNPAFFAADFNLLVAGSEMNRFVAELARVRKQHHDVLAEYDRRLKDLPRRLKELAQELDQANYPAEERPKVLLAEQKRMEDERRAIENRIRIVERKNTARFQEVSGAMFTRLFHEAFHAYLENYVYPRQEFDVPRWLNEGLAQVFESGLLDVDTLRVDVPNGPALAALQKDLRGPAPLGLAELLAADANTFLKTHRGASATASRLYCYSWGLAYYFTFDQSLFAGPAFEAYIRPAAAELAPVARFEQWVGMPLAEFEPKWRAAMLALKY